MRTVSSSSRSSARAERTSGALRPEPRNRQQGADSRQRAAGRDAPPAAQRIRSVGGLAQLVVNHLYVGFQPRLLNRPVAGVLGRHLPAGGKLVNALPGLLPVANGSEELLVEVGKFLQVVHR